MLASAGEVTDCAYVPGTATKRYGGCKIERASVFCIVLRLEGP